MYLKENLKYLRKSKNISQDKMAEHLGYKSFTTIQKWETGIAEPPFSKIYRIAEYLGVSVNDLTYEKLWEAPKTPKLPSNIMPIEIKKVPLLGEVACGELKFANEEFEGYVACGADIQADFALRANGDSMSGARILDGDIVFVRKQETVENGEIAVVLQEDEATLKRFRRVGDVVILSPENPAFNDIVVDLKENTNIRILGKAIAFQSDCR